MAPFIDHSEYEKDAQVSCACAWKGLPKDCYSTLHAAFMDLHCPSCRQTVLVIDTLGTECGSFVPRPIPRPALKRRSPLIDRLLEA